VGVRQACDEAVAADFETVTKRLRQVFELFFSSQLELANFAFFCYTRGRSDM
jgi:hypothetical protein